MSAHPLPRRSGPPRGLLAGLLVQLSAYLLEPALAAEPAVEASEPRPYPVVAVVGAARRSGATTVARALATELAIRSGRGAVVSCAPGSLRHGGPPSRTAVRLATALHGIAAAEVRVWRRLCLVPSDDLTDLAAAGRYLAPVVLDVPADGSGSSVSPAVDTTLVVASASDEPSLAAALSATLPGANSPLVVVTRTTASDQWTGRADIALPEARLAARAALAGSRPSGALGRAIAKLADRCEGGR
jgi:hypothetical protein